jgi:hypothetical protein
VTIEEATLAIAWDLVADIRRYAEEEHLQKLALLSDETLNLLNHREVAAILRLTPESFSQVIFEGRFDVPYVKRGRLKYWPVSDIRGYLESLLVDPQECRESAP